MGSKRFLPRKFCFIALFLTSLLIVFPTSSTMADGFVSLCLENPEECEEDKVPVSEPTTEKDSINTGANITAWEYIQTGFALVFVIGLLFAILKFVNRKNRLYNKNQLMKNMGGISLGQQKSVQLVVIGNQYYLIGVGDDIRLLKEITDSTEIETLTEYYEEVDGTSPLGWIDRLIGLISEFRKKKESQSNNESSDFSNIFNTRLEEMKEERKRQISRLTEKERNQDE